ncbi:S8 family serine peptidase [Enterococcus sp. MMGLQ5-2]|nr:InlB B-repeat-containing protein [Enterococcus sp. MMGLQ5-2]MBS7583182.1 InlB B-repeat-containing protein [Enterococcus sp. MMGLQ5-1]NPD11042.1 S8 family serine peptidase [Enterococcus sp. MMGLQ5-1]NPD35785.1 S8 family serine peptidase [Enterococcus sp. MMGLQ5-2]
MADYSSWGGNTELDFKPEITAFGGGGKNASDYAYGPHTDNSSYNGMAGTSQATPLVSASAGLVKKALSAYYSGKELADKVDLALINTSQPLMEVAEQPYSPRKQGAGLIQVQRAIQNKVELTDIASSSDTQSDGILELKQITSRLITRQINLKNTSSTPMSYHWKDLGVYKNADSISANQALTDVAVNYSEVFIKDAKGYLTENTDTITVPANASIDLTVEINVSGDFSGNNFIEGFIRLVPIGSDEVEIGVPFMGFADNLPQTVTATFDANGGTIVDLATRKAEINTYLGNLPQANYSEKSFLGWYTSRNGGEKISERTKIAASTTYYARWDRLFTLNINKDNSPWQNHNKQFTLKQDTNIIATSTILEGNPVFTNVLDGNYDLYEGAKKLISQLTVTNDATQTLDYYTVSFDTNGAESNVPISQIVYKGKTCDIPSNQPVKKGYDFVKWVTVDGSTAFDFLNIVTAKTAYAKWQVITYPISYELDGGTNFSNPPSSYTVETSTITLANPTKQGFSFDGWYQEAEFTTKVTEIRRGSFGAITLFAKWRQNQTGNSEGSSGNEDQPTEEKPVEQMPSEEKPNQEIPSVSVEEPIIRFSDIVSLNQESISAIQWLVDQQITTGYQSNNNNVRMFGPHDTLTRGQMVTFLYRFMGQPFISKTSTSFVDISNCSEEFKTAIAWAKEGGITTGYNKFYFGPNDSITREQITAFLYRLADSPKVTSKTTFTDISQESQFYNSITWLSSQGVIKGYNSQQFGPTDFTTREQMALIIKRFNDADIVKHS